MGLFPSLGNFIILNFLLVFFYLTIMVQSYFNLVIIIIGLFFIIGIKRGQSTGSFIKFLFNSNIYSISGTFKALSYKKNIYDCISTGLCWCLYSLLSKLRGIPPLLIFVFFSIICWNNLPKVLADI